MRKNPDWNTINIEALKKLPIYSLPPTYHLQREPGNGCAMDAPGYPTYFTRSVYTSHGNTPRKGPQMVISYDGVNYVIEDTKDWENCGCWDAYREKGNKKLHRLWKPLPLDHPRTRAWIAGIYQHMKHCYTDDSKTGSDRTIVFPVPSYHLKSFRDDPRFSDEWREKEKASIDQANKETIEYFTRIAIPENHSAVRMIRRFYPDYQPETDLIENPPAHQGNWYETSAEKPTPEDCPGQYGSKHPVNGSWCQWCGWREEKEVESK